MSDSLQDRIGTHGLGVLVTIKRDGRPQLSNVTYVYDGERIRVSLTDDVLEGKAELSPVAADPYDEVVEELVDYYRTASGEHSDWDDYRAAMVRDKRLVFSMTVDHAYGMPSPS